MAALRTMPPAVKRMRPALRVLPKKTEDIYATAEWRTARRRAIVRADWRCCVCNVHAQRLYVDHKVELKDGGAPYEQSNLQVLCAKHHTLKTHAARLARTGRLR